MSTAAVAAVAARAFVVVAAAAATTMFAVAGTGDAGSTYTGSGPLLRILGVGAAVSLLLVALVLAHTGGTLALAVAAASTALVWLAPLVLGWQAGPPGMRTAAAMVVPLLPVFLAALVLAAPVAPRKVARLVGRSVVAVGAVCVVGAAVARALVRDPLRDLACWSDCTLRPVLPHQSFALVVRVTHLLLAAQLALGLLACALAVVLVRASSAVERRLYGAALAAAGLAGAAQAAFAAEIRWGPAESPVRVRYEWLFAARAVALLLLAGGLAWAVIRPLLVRRRVTRLALDLERSTAPDGLARLLAAEGDILGGGQRLGAAAEVALGNERLRMEALARLDEATESRARLVEAAEAARRRMERDLHDGAQQRMLALGYDLLVAVAEAERRGNVEQSGFLRAAHARAEEAARELREIAGGLYPPALQQYGLAAALESLADTQPLALQTTLPAGRRYPARVEAAAYAVVAEAAAQLPSLRVAVGESDGILELRLVGWPDAPTIWLEDRAGAVGGVVSAQDSTLRITFALA